jgi:segregation and condensation protein B
MNYKAIIEGLLFVSGNEGLSLKQICDITEKTKEEVSEIIKQLYSDYESIERGINIEFLGNKFKLTTKLDHKDFYKKLIKDEQNSTLSQSALETLAIIAYNGPITRIEIDEIRGVNSSYVIRRLLLKGLIEAVGKSDIAGKPIIYNVTTNFLDYFGLGTIQELPEINLTNLKNENFELDLFNSKYTEKEIE